MDPGTILILIIFGFFGMQLYSWTTSSNAGLTGMAASGIGGGFFGYIIDTYTRSSIVLTNCWDGAYGTNGYFTVFSIILFVIAMLINAFSDLIKNKPIRLIH